MSEKPRNSRIVQAAQARGVNGLPAPGVPPG